MKTENQTTDQNQDQAKSEASKEVSSHKLSDVTAVKAISQSMVAGRKALRTELAVCLAIFAAKGDTSKEAKEIVTKVYSQAGYEVADSNSRHYKTVNRRVNASASLFEKVGVGAIAKWVDGTEEQKMIEAIVKGLDEYKFDSMDDVLDFIGKSSNRKASASAAANDAQAQGKAAAAQKEGEKDKASIKVKEVPMQHFAVGRVKVDLPEAMAAADMLKLAAKIIDAARKKEQAELQASMARVSDAKAPMAMGPLH
jgi:hypothetical protein